MTRRARSSRDERFMRLALAQAAKGVGRTSPNPAVGAVIVKAGRVVGKGYHHRAGLPHAEVLALRQAGARARGADLYVTLEPCNHQGRTPPCSEAVLAAGIARVFCASADPNPLVSGKGVQRLRRAGLEVTAGLLRADADLLNRPFFKFMREGLPWVSLKAAVTLDGALAAADGSSKWVTGEASRALGHRLRDHHDAVLVGAGTVRKDNPQLTTRTRGGRDAVRIVLDAQLRLPPSRALFALGRAGAGSGRRSTAPTVVITALDETHPRAKRLASKGVQIWTVGMRGGRLNLKQVLRRITDAGLRSVLVEGGAAVHASFLREGLADVLYLFLAPKLVGAGGLTWSGPLGIRSMRRAKPVQVEALEVLDEDVLLQVRLR